MRENRPYGSEGGVAKSHPAHRRNSWIGAIRLSPIAPYIARNRGV